MESNFYEQFCPNLNSAEIKNSTPEFNALIDEYIKATPRLTKIDNSSTKIITSLLKDLKQDLEINSKEPDKHNKR